MQKSPALRGQRVDKTEADSRVQRGCSCGAPLEYSQQYDADFCRRCDCWRESACRDPACDFCATRPERPSLSQRVEPIADAPFNTPRLKAAKQRATTTPKRDGATGSKNKDRRT